MLLTVWNKKDIHATPTLKYVWWLKDQWNGEYYKDVYYPESIVQIGEGEGRMHRAVWRWQCWEMDDWRAHIWMENKNSRWIWLAKELVPHFVEGGSVSVCVWCLCSSQGRVAPGGHLGQWEFSSEIRRLHYWEFEFSWWVDSSLSGKNQLQSVFNLRAQERFKAPSMQAQAHSKGLEILHGFGAQLRGWRL